MFSCCPKNGKTPLVYVPNFWNWYWVESKLFWNMLQGQTVMILIWVDDLISIAFDIVFKVGNLILIAFFIDCSLYIGCKSYWLHLRLIAATYYCVKLLTPTFKFFYGFMESENSDVYFKVKVGRGCCKVVEEYWQIRFIFWRKYFIFDKYIEILFSQYFSYIDKYITYFNKYLQMCLQICFIYILTNMFQGQGIQRML